MSDQPKPAGEWTGKTVADVAFPGGHHITPILRERIADAHNAALAEATDAAVQEMLLVKQQLAAKDELHAAALQVLERHHQKQLDAEQGTVQTLVDALKIIRGCAPDIVKQEIKDALAKVGK